MKDLPPIRNWLVFLWLALALALPVATQGRAAPLASAAKVEQIDAFVSQQIVHHRLPGLALALVEGDQVIFMKGYGNADQTGRPITPQTPFLLASVSKPLTATAILRFVETGKVDLDAPVQRYVPEFRVADPDISKQITVRHLLVHTSGLPSTACDTRADADTLAEYVAELQTVTLAAPPGTQHIYCSGNYNLLGRIVEKVSRQSFGSYMQQAVFEPLGMRHTFTDEQEALQVGMAQGYQWFFGGLVPTHHRFNASQLPSGSMISSVEDMSHFLIAQLNGGQYAGEPILSASSIAAMQTPGTQRGGNGGYGLGWVIAPVGDVPAVWHDGVAYNYHSMLLMQPETKRGVVLLANAFGLVAYESAYKEIEAGIARLMAGLEPASGSRVSLTTTYLMIDAILAGLMALALWPLLHIRRWYARLSKQHPAGRQRLGWAVVRAVWEIGFGLVILIAVRVVLVTGLGAQSWLEVLAAFPDFVVWVWGFALASLLSGAIRIALILRAWGMIRSSQRAPTFIPVRRG
jgi:CubicO group peptidase (beta-lactamase class C family)